MTASRRMSGALIAMMAKYKRAGDNRYSFPADRVWAMQIAMELREILEKHGELVEGHAPDCGWTDWHSTCTCGSEIVGGGARRRGREASK